VLGSELAALLAAGCHASWENGANVLVEHARYNAGWCWIHDAPGNTRCIIFVKNFIDQAVEIAEVPGLVTLESILRIESDDLVLYPLICSDLISAQLNSPRARIERTLPALTKQVAVCTISCNPAPHSGWWRTAIDHVVQMHQQRSVLIVANQAVTLAQVEEEDDKWRCLTGVFISRTRMPKPPRLPLPHVRDISTEVASRGLILRHPADGVAVGQVSWDLSSPAVGLYVWAPGIRWVWKNDRFVPLDKNAAYYETCRFVSRRANSIVSQYDEAVRQPILDVLNAIASDSETTNITPRLWPELCNGLKPSSKTVSADHLNEYEDDLDLAFGIFAAVQFATNGSPIQEGAKRGQLRWGDNELRVWQTSSLRDHQMFISLQQLALDGGSAPPLIVIGSGRRVGINVPAQQVEAPIEQPPAQQALPVRQTDITHAMLRSHETSDIESPRPRSVFWRPMREVENVLLDPPADLASAICAAITVNFNLA
jgi:hypothetical protein